MYSGTGGQLKNIYGKFAKLIEPIHKAYLECIHSLVNLVEARDPYTKRHSVKVSNYSVAIAKKLKLSKQEIENIRLAAILHDIGKLGVRKKVLLKKSSLNYSEYEEVKKHPEVGTKILRPLKFFKNAIAIIKHHHENYDGTGYPAGLKGKDIPLGARILAVADVYDALMSRRAYRESYLPKDALEIMEREGGKKFDPEILKVFLEYLHTKEQKKKA